MRKQTVQMLFTASLLLAACSSSDKGADATADQGLSEASVDLTADLVLPDVASPETGSPDTALPDSVVPDSGPPPQDPASTSGKALYNDIAVDGQKVYVAWTDGRHGANEIYFRRSLDGGKTWEAEQRLTNDEVESTWPTLAVDGKGAIHIAWRDNTLGHWTGFYAVSSDSGKTFSKPVDATKYPASYGYTHPSIGLAARGSRVYLAWDDNRTGVHDVYWRVSNDAGKTWFKTGDLNGSRDFCQGITVALGAPNTAHFAYLKGTSTTIQMFYTRSTDGGKTVAADLALSDVSLVKQVSPPGIGANDKGDVVAVYVVDGALWVRHSADSGKTWDKAMEMVAASKKPATAPVFGNGVAAIDGSNAYAVFSETIAGTENSEIFIVRSEDAGKTWNTPERVTFAKGASWGARLALDSSSVHIIWTDGRSGGGEIYHTRLPR